MTNVQLSPEDYDAIEEGMSEPQIVESRVMRIIEEEFNPHLRWGQRDGQPATDGQAPVEDRSLHQGEYTMRR